MNLLTVFAKLVLDTGEYEKSMTDAEKKAYKAGEAIGNGLHGVGNMAKTGLSAAADFAGKVVGGVAKATAAATAAGAAGIGALTKQAVDSYASYEQLAGGVETLFGNSAQVVLNNAQNAFKTAGMSINQYMETSIQSAAALINSLGGDQEEAARLMDVSIIDMSDNVNKMGTTMEAVQNAYRGFSRGNFTMLDNLALGFSGTKQGMQELLDKAQEISGIKYDISSYSDIVEAIHVVQQEMGISGTTAAEAANTISGSMGSVKAAWQNLVTGMADENADLDKLMDDLVNSVAGTTDKAGNHINGFLDNMLPRIEKAINGVGKFIEKAVPVLLEKVPPMISRLLPNLLTSASNLVSSIVKQLPTLFQSIIQTIKDNGPTLIAAVGDLIGGIATALPELLFMILDEIPNLIHTIGENIFNNLPQIIEGITTFVPQLLTKIFDIMISLAEEIINHLPEIIEAAGQIIFAIIKGLIENLPKLIAKIPDIVMGILEGFGRLLGPIGEIGVNLIKNLWEGIKSGVGALLELIGNIATAIIDGIKNLPGQILDFGKNIITGLWEGIQWGIGKLGEVIASIGQAIWDGITYIPRKIFEFGQDLIKNLTGAIEDGDGDVLKTMGNIGKVILDALASIPKAVFDIGANIVKGLIDGIGSLAKGAVDAVGGFFGGIVDGAKNFLGIHSPSKVFAQIGKFTAEGFEEGFDDQFKAVKKVIDGDFDSLSNPDIDMHGNLSYTTTRASSTDTLLNTLIAKIDALNGQQIILDTGVLVGQTVSKMDSALGQLANKNMRGVLV